MFLIKMTRRNGLGSLETRGFLSGPPEDSKCLTMSFLLTLDTEHGFGSLLTRSGSLVVPVYPCP